MNRLVLCSLFVALPAQAQPKPAAEAFSFNPQPTLLTAADAFPVHAMAYSPDGALLAVAGDGGRIALWDVKEQIIAHLTGHVIIHHEEFQQLESAWRGLHYLVNNTETDEMLKIRVMNVSKNELGQDAQEVQGHGLGPEPDLQEDLRGGVRPARRRAVRLPGRRLLLRPQPAGRRAAGRDGEDRGGRARAVHRRRRADADADGHLAASWPTRAT